MNNNQIRLQVQCPIYMYIHVHVHVHVYVRMKKEQQRRFQATTHQLPHHTTQRQTNYFPMSLNKHIEAPTHLTTLYQLTHQVVLSKQAETVSECSGAEFNGVKVHA